MEKRTGPWDRRIPNMPTWMGKCLRWLYKSRNRFWTLFTMACIGWMWFVSVVTIWLYVRFPEIITTVFRF